MDAAGNRRDAAQESIPKSPAPDASSVIVDMATGASTDASQSALLSETPKSPQIAPNRSRPSIWTPRRYSDRRRASSGSDVRNQSSQKIQPSAQSPFLEPDKDIQQPPPASHFKEPNPPDAPLVRFSIENDKLHPLQFSQKATKPFPAAPPPPPEDEELSTAIFDKSGHIRHHVVEIGEVIHDYDPISGKKLINKYEIIRLLGRGEHGKVKLARDLRTGEEVAIKEVMRVVKTRLSLTAALRNRAENESGLARLRRQETSVERMGPQERKIRREIAILKKVSHPNVVRLREVLDDGVSRKVYLVFDYVENGDVIWQRSTDAAFRKRWRREENRILYQTLPGGRTEGQKVRRKNRRKRRQERKQRRLRMFGGADFWSLEFEEEDEDSNDSDSTVAAAKPSLKLQSSGASTSNHSALGPKEPSASAPDLQSLTLADRDPYWPSSSSSSDEDDEHVHEAVPVLTLTQVRRVFRDTVAGVSYLHHNNIIHRDIKPANLLWSKSYRVKISDFGISYLGRDAESDDESSGSESEVITVPRPGILGGRRFIGRWERERERERRQKDRERKAKERRERTQQEEERELAKTEGTPAFLAPELCYTDLRTRMPITNAIDIWSLGVTLYCFIYGRIPFTAEGEFGLYHVIATESLVLPEFRVRVVKKHASHPSLPATPSIEAVPEWPEHENAPTGPESTHEPAFNPARHDSFLETVPPSLLDLLAKLLDKDPTSRIDIDGVRHHPWVLEGIPDPQRWLEDTDPARAHGGRKIEVAPEELEVAVVPVLSTLNSAPLMQRVRSSVRKILGRKRAVSGTSLASPLEGSSVDIHERPNLDNEATHINKSSHHSNLQAQGGDGASAVSSQNTPEKRRSVSLGQPPFATPLKRATSTSAESTSTLRGQIRERHLSSTAAPPSTPTGSRPSGYITSGSASGTGTPRPRPVSSSLLAAHTAYTMEHGDTMGLDGPNVSGPEHDHLEHNDKSSSFDRFFQAGRKLVRQVRSRDFSAESHERLPRHSHRQRQRHASRDRSSNVGGSSRESSRTRSSSVAALSEVSSVSAVGGFDAGHSDQDPTSPSRNKTSLRRRSGMFGFGRSRDALDCTVEEHSPPQAGPATATSSRRSSGQSFLVNSSSNHSLGGFLQSFGHHHQTHHNAPRSPSLAGHGDGFGGGLPSMDPAPGLGPGGLRVDTTHTHLSPGRQGPSFGQGLTSEDVSFYEKQTGTYRRALSDRTNARPQSQPPISSPFQRFQASFFGTHLAPHASTGVPHAVAPRKNSSRPASSGSSASASKFLVLTSDPSHDSPPLQPSPLAPPRLSGHPMATDFPTSSTVRPLNTGNSQGYFDLAKSPEQEKSISQFSPQRRQSMPPLGSPQSTLAAGYGQKPELPSDLPSKVTFSYDRTGFSAYPLPAMPSATARASMAAAHSPTLSKPSVSPTQSKPNHHLLQRRNFSSSEEDAAPYDLTTKFAAGGIAYPSSLSNSTSYPSMLSITSSASMASGSDDYGASPGTFTTYARGKYESMHREADGVVTPATTLHATSTESTYPVHEKFINAAHHQVRVAEADEQDLRFADAPPSSSSFGDPLSPTQEDVDAETTSLQLHEDVLDDGDVADDDFDDSDDDGLVLNMSRSKRFDSPHHRRRKTGESMRSVRSVRSVKSNKSGKRVAGTNSP